MVLILQINVLLQNITSATANRWLPGLTRETVTMQATFDSHVQNASIDTGQSREAVANIDKYSWNW